MIGFGLSRVKITPKMGSFLFGQIEQIRCTDIYTDLYARALYLSNINMEALIMSADLLCFPKETMDYIRFEISKKTQIDYKNIVVHTTHTHAGPTVTPIFNENNIDKETYEFILNGIISAGIEAKSNIKKGTLGFSIEPLEISFNRRYIMKNNNVEMHPFKDDPNILKVEGPNEKELNVLIIKDENNKICCAISNYPCHLTSLERGNTKISADFPAYAEIELQDKYGEDFVLLFLNGPCGNLCPINVMDKSSCEVGPAWVCVV